MRLVQREALRLGLDIDGCLADFNTGFIALIKQMTGIQLPVVSSTYPDVWNYHRAGGVTKEQDAVLWAKIKFSSFWQDLPALPGTAAALRNLANWRTAGHEIYFITSRPGQLAKYQTEEWLKVIGFSIPTVLIADSEAAKGDLARGLNLDAFIDDKPENCAAVLNATRYGLHCTPGENPIVTDWAYPCAVYLFDAPYNQTYNDPHVTRVGSVQAMLDRLLQEQFDRLESAA